MHTWVDMNVQNQEKSKRLPQGLDEKGVEMITSRQKNRSKKFDYDLSSPVRVSGLEDQDLRRIVEACVRLTDGTSEEIAGNASHGFISYSENVRETHWIDEEAQELLGHDNNSEEIINRYGGGD